MIIFTVHAKDKISEELEKLGVTKRVVIEILRKPDELLYDTSADRFIALNWNYDVAVVYEKTDNNLVVITVIYSSELKHVVDKRKRIGRWI